MNFIQRIGFATITFIVRNFFFRLRGGIKVEGKENIPMSGPVLFTSVHVSFLDPPLIACVLPRPTACMGKEELFRSLLGPILRFGGVFPVKRGENDTSAIKYALKVLKKGGAILMFPEGSRGDGKHLGEIKSGLGMLAKRSGAQIVPVGISGPEKALPSGAKKLKKAHFKVCFGEPFTYNSIAVANDERKNRELFVNVLCEKIVSESSKLGLHLKI